MRGAVSVYVACHEQLQFVFHFIGLLFIINGEVHLVGYFSEVCEGRLSVSSVTGFKQNLILTLFRNLSC